MDPVALRGPERPVIKWPAGMPGRGKKTGRVGRGGRTKPAIEERCEPDRLFPAIYEELRSIAHTHLHRAANDDVLQTTALVHEVYLRLRGQARTAALDRSHYLAIAARTLRRVLVDHLRARNVVKRGAPWGRVQLSGELIGQDRPSIDLLALEDALEKLAAAHERRARVVELRFFGGLSIEEAAEVLGVSARTVKDDWTIARAFLFRELRNSGT